MNAIFVYGILKGAEGALSAHVYGYRLADMGMFPAAIPAENAKIVGELIYVDDDRIKDFDRIEGHPNFYARTDVEVETDAGDFIIAEMYVINNAYHDRQSIPTASLDIASTNNQTSYEYFP